MWGTDDGEDDGEDGTEVKPSPKGWREKTGSSGCPADSKSKVAAAPVRPSASRTPARRICQREDSFSNLISVFVGEMLTSMVAGSTSKKRK